MGIWHGDDLRGDNFDIGLMLRDAFERPHYEPLPRCASARRRITHAMFHGLPSGDRVAHFEGVERTSKRAKRRARGRSA